jgi:hypothetical protein
VGTWFGVGVGGTAVGLGVGVDASAARHCENSEVLPFGSVAVAVICNWPSGKERMSGPKLALP